MPNTTKKIENYAELPGACHSQPKSMYEGPTWVADSQAKACYA